MLEYDEKWFADRCTGRLGMDMVVKGRYRVYANEQAIDVLFTRKPKNGSYINFYWDFDDGRGEDGITMKVEDFAKVEATTFIGLGILIKKANDDAADLRAQINQRKHTLAAEAKRILIK